MFARGALRPTTQYHNSHISFITFFQFFSQVKPAVIRGLLAVVSEHMVLEFCDYV